MALTVTIGGVSYPIIENNGQPVPGYTSAGGGTSSSSGNTGIAGGSDSGYQQTNNAQERQRWQCDIMDYSGTAHFQKGELVVVTDPVLGIMFQGYINTDKELPIYPSGIIRHSLDCIGLEWLPSKRTFTRTYSTSQVAGKIAVDMLNTVLLPEGIAQNFAEHDDSTTAAFNTGILSGTQGVTDANGNQWLELAQAGSNTVITENTTALFSTGTLTNVQAINNELIPTTVSGLKVVATLPFTQNNPSLTVNFWSGSQSLGTNDTLNFTIFISSTSPSITCSVGLMFNDGTSTTGIVDQNGFAIDASTDISANAKDRWYTRAFSTTTYNGKTISKVYVSFGGTSAGTYTMYVQNVSLSSGTVFFSTTATTTQLNPMVVASSQGYAPTSVIASVNPVFNAGISIRTSPAYSIDAVKLLSSSTVSWTAGVPSGGTFVLKSSYDGGVTYQPCTNNAALPALPAGSNVAGLSITLQESFTTGTDPTILPTLSQVVISLYSAPTATKSDIVTTYATSTQWNTGTFTGTQVVSNNLASGNITQGWDQSQIINQTFLATSNSTQSVSAGTFSITTLINTASANRAGAARLDWAGTITNTNFTFDIDITVPSTVNYSSVGFIQYLQTYWGVSGVDTGKGAYTLWMQQSGINNNITLYRGTNSSTSTATTVAQTTQNTPNHVRIVVKSGVHSIYFDNNATAIFSFTDTTYTSGQIAIGGFTFFQNPNGGGYSTVTFKNPVVTPLPTETWASTSTSVSSLGTCESSVISWTELHTQTADGENAAIFIESSIDGGTTYQTCTNGSAIPGLTSGTNLSGKSVQLLINFYVSPSNFYIPQLSQLVWRVLGAYPGSSGTRSTVPLGNDMSITRTVASGFGTAFDGQTWSQTGTGTTAVASGEETITNTTGDVHMHLGTRTWTDEDGTVRFQLSASTISAGIELRYTDANNFYRLQVSTTTVSIIKVQSGVSVMLQSVSMTVSTGVWYRARFRVTGAIQPLLQGNVWLDGQLENTINATTGQWNNNSWTIQVND
jgi:hypothetical protein